MQLLVDLRAGSSNHRLLSSSSVLEMYILLTVPATGAIFKETLEREQCVEITWKVYLTDPQ